MWKRKAIQRKQQRNQAAGTVKLQQLLLLLSRECWGSLCLCATQRGRQQEQQVAKEQQQQQRRQQLLKKQGQRPQQQQQHKHVPLYVVEQATPAPVAAAALLSVGRQASRSRCGYTELAAHQQQQQQQAST